MMEEETGMGPARGRGGMLPGGGGGGVAPSAAVPVSVPPGEGRAVEAARPTPGREHRERGKEEGRGRHKVRSIAATITSLFWRFWQLAAAVTALAVMTAANQNGLAFQNFQAFIWLVTAMTVVIFWAVHNIFRDLAALLPKSVSRAMRLFLEFVVAWIALSGASAAAGLTTFADRGLGSIQPGYCQVGGYFDSVCARTKASTAMAFITFFLFIPTLISLTTLTLLMLRESDEDTSQV